MERMQVSQAGLELIKHFEGLRLKAYRCPAGIWTIGYGHTGPEVREGMTINDAEAARLLRQDLVVCEAAVARQIQVYLNQGQFDALVSFVFNLGAGALAKSTLKRKLNAKDYDGAADEFPRWCRSGGVVLTGLMRRRKAERAMFLGRDWRAAL